MNLKTKEITVRLILCSVVALNVITYIYAAYNAILKKYYIQAPIQAGVIFIAMTIAILLLFPFLKIFTRKIRLLFTLSFVWPLIAQIMMYLSISDIFVGTFLLIGGISTGTAATLLYSSLRKRNAIFCDPPKDAENSKG